MSPTSRPRRSIALLATLVLAITGLSLVPASTASAYFQSSSRGKLILFIDFLRDNAGQGEWPEVPVLDNWTEDWATSYAACKGCSNPSNLPHYTPAPIDSAVLYHATASTGAKRVAKLEALISSNSTDDVDDAWGSIGYATHGDTAYLYIVGFTTASGFSTFTSFTSGSSLAIHGTQRVGSTLSVTVPTLSPTPTSYVYAWTVKKDGTTTLVGDGSTYTLAPDDLGGTVYVDVSAFATDVSIFTFRTHTGEIKHGHFLDPKIVAGGNRVVGQTIEYTISSTPAPGTMTYTWYRNDKKFTNVGNTYTFVAGDKGKRIDIKIVIAADGFTPVTLRTYTSKKVTAP